uniref:NADH-ubiquinone oxidoreductase chain 3 n=1 Tax=Noteridae sp. MJTNT-2012 TaxID=1227477 RepID=S4SUK6_9COLE|nr:NADH dehydrogenase subunit 3 [Noteridae sp. MJTNT-2012]
MKIIVLTASIILLISSAMMISASVISKKTFTDREKNSPFECGFDPANPPRLPFSLQFFLIAIIFLIFDVEIALILPMIPIMSLSNMYQWVTTSMILITILILGLLHEWKQGALDWSS